ncbi:MAG: DNA polymerase III subunit gamma/tau [Rubrobacteraceae bacterium]
MKHTTLYRKWRPRRFGAIVGQEPVVRTLRRAIETDRVAHAYLFSGPRGTGKTSTAKVLAMGLNCVQGPTPEPDGTCESCRAITNNSSMDVLEMDAASNRGIDEIRELRDRVNLAPASGRMKVYIIDEVHMLTAEAFNALLKMLEEPPEHVIFVLATTEKHKVLPTIISRCQSFDFRRPGVDTLSEKLAEISEAEGIEAEAEALTIIAREGKGSFRDAEGLLDQLSSFADGPITAALVRELLGSVGAEALLETTAALHEKRVAEALKAVDRLSNEGRDLGQFVGEMIRHLRVLMLLPHAPEVALAEVGANERAALEAQAGEIPTAEVVRILEALGDASGRIKRGGDPKLELELTFLKLVRNYTEPDVDTLLSRLETLEAAAASGSGVPANVAHSPQTPTEPDAPTPEPAAEPAAEPEAVAAEPAEKPGSKATGEETPAEPPTEEPATKKPSEAEGKQVSAREVASAWDGILQDMRDQRQVPAAAVYEEARVEGFDGKVLQLSFPEDLAIYAKLAADERHSNALQSALNRRFGVKPRLECRAGGASELSGAGDPAPAADPPRAPSSAPSRKPVPREPAIESEMPPETGPPNLDPPDPEPPDSDPPDPEPREEWGENLQEGGTGFTGGGRPPEADGDDGTIGSVQEVLAIARERFGPSNDNGGG